VCVYICNGWINKFIWKNIFTKINKKDLCQKFCKTSGVIIDCYSITHFWREKQLIISGFTKKNKNSLPPLDPFRIFSCFILFVKILPTLIFSSCTLVFLKFIIQEYIYIYIYRFRKSILSHIYCPIYIYKNYISNHLVDDLIVIT
jgi:hypothetical protein